MEKKIKSNEICKYIDKIIKANEKLVEASRRVNSLQRGFDVLLDNEYGVGKVDSVDLRKKTVILFDDLVKDLDVYKRSKEEVRLPEDVEVTVVDRTEEVVKGDAGVSEEVSEEVKSVQ